MARRLKCIAFLALAFGAGWTIYPKPQTAGAGALKPTSSINVHDFLAANCFGCHDSQTKKGNLDLTSLRFVVFSDCRASARPIASVDAECSAVLDAIERPSRDWELIFG